ncbi:MAG TPA: DUF2147 domain-containing protein [Spirochaetota bacterium]|nr:DUF2147 domain-containing protein [Spirochaetota bacterium]HPV40956.1 DUF2147 domain-containing protein [Spirochaetota bacterium]
MKKTMIALTMVAFCIMLTVTLLAAFTADSVIGTWLVPKGDAKVTIYKCGEKFCGKVSWLKTPEDLDTKNPDPAKRKNKILGMDMLWGFHFEKGEWVGGQIYDPDSGDTYKCKMYLKSDDKLNVRGYVGVPLFGRSEIWTRVK